MKANILGLYETNTPKKEGHGYIKTVINSETEMVCSVESNQKVNQDLEFDGIKYQLDTEHEDDLSPPNTTVNPKIHCNAS